MPSPSPHNKRKSPPGNSSPSSSTSKRQRLDPAAALIAEEAEAYESTSSLSDAELTRESIDVDFDLEEGTGAEEEEEDDDGEDDGEATGTGDGEEEDEGEGVSSPEVELRTAVGNGNGAAAGKSVRKGHPLASAMAAGDDDDDEEEEHEDEDEESQHPPISAKQVPSSQPVPPTTKQPLRPTVGGKGKAGEEALEHAVAAREQVERRRVELKGNKETQAGLVAHEAAKKLKESKEKDKDEAVVKKVETKVVDGEELVVVKEEEVDAVVEEAEEAAPVKRERPSIAEEKAGIIQFLFVTNDGSERSLIVLAGLKRIFQAQLPKMPREYIARLVFDRNHYSMAIVKRGLEVVGGITYRPFEARKFAEIVFCAVTGTEQVKGYGSHMMNHLKDHVKASTACMHFLTYADNYAIGYFKKQGFTKEVGLDRSVWAGYIKDYEGGTIMHCSMLPRIKYLDVSSILSRQKEVILAQIRQSSQSHVVHPGLPASLFQSLPPEGSIDPSLVPGLKESGWTPEMDELTRRPKRGPNFAIMQKLLTLLVDHPSSWAFQAPVNGNEVTDYYTVIKEPMDLATMDSKLEANRYTTLDEFKYDAQLIFDNCRKYNDSSSNYSKNATKLENYLNEQLKIYVDP
ncbi:histone acetyltransferase Gcn5 [Pseudohyphozyma bogoriensis]|nr:histone acetyltransferase Gcn5 [Pseudohyphozyma bogoriensis]